MDERMIGLESVVARHQGWVYAEPGGIRADLSNRMLDWISLPGALLPGATFQDSRLVSGDFQYADLRQANLIGADLSLANLRGADLRGANLSGASLLGAHLEGADLRGANLRDANLKGAKLVGAKLNSARLMGANLTWVDFTDANLTDADLSSADLTWSTLKGTVMVAVSLRSARVTRDSFKGVGSMRASDIRGVVEIHLEALEREAAELSMKLALADEAWRRDMRRTREGMTSRSDGTIWVAGELDRLERAWEGHAF